MKLFEQLAGIATLVIVAVFFILGDLVMFFVLTPLVYLRPSARTKLLGGFAQFMGRGVLGILRSLGGTRFDLRARIPAQGGVLVVMNHQSLVDIPVAFASVPSGYPRMVARARYGRGIPLVSHMISLYGHILVQPGKTGRLDLDRLAETARASTLPILIFPEGHRTRDGEIQAWKRAGLDTLLSAREWTVYVVVVDGLWKVARLTDFIRNLARVQCRAEMAGPFTYDGRDRERHDEFVNELRRVMCDKLAEMRGAPVTETAALPGTRG
ncbi:MAG TPA: 1-acyl-sn-glycerol-3-phosphate acyltransferase [Candidatus Krumholzibacteria bacterium]|nr:1-acyl-sn-glycerol-3-phosphate acyltransferase [Candidatus Krumholzibacteria bacterium]